MNRSAEERRQELETYRQKMTRRFCMKWEDDHNVSNMAEPLRPPQREADSTDLRRLNNYVKRVRAIFRAPTLPPNTAPIPRPVTVGTQTWPTTTFKPLMRINSYTTAPTENTPDLKANKANAESEAINSQPSLDKNKKVIQGHKSKRRYKTKSKWVKNVGFNLVSKSGRYDHATIIRSVTPVINAKPSRPFQ